MKTQHIISLGAILAGSLFPAGVRAQDLNKEITIDREIVPEQRAAARPTVFPTVKLPEIKKVSLRMQEAEGNAPVATGLSRFEPALTEAAFGASPWRGYVDLGYFPSLDVALSAGYAIIAREATGLNVWLQADNRDYKYDSSPYGDFRWKSLDISGGLDFVQRFGSYNRLRLSTDVAYSGWSFPETYYGQSAVIPVTDPTVPVEAPASSTLNNFRWNLRGSFEGRYSDHLTYGVGARFGLFNNKKVREALPDAAAFTLPAANQTIFGFNGNVREQVSDNAAVGLDIEGKFLHYGHFFNAAALAAESPSWEMPLDGEVGGKTLGQIDFLPAVEYNGGSFYGRAGARLGLSFNSGKTFHVAPDVTLGVNPDSRFGAWLKFGGGVETNPMERLFATSRYSDFRAGYHFSNLAFTGQLGLRIGPFYGASLTLTADYAAANDWLMPFQSERNQGEVYNFFLAQRMRSWKIGGRIDWQYRSLVEVALSYEGTLGDDNDKNWIYWSDRARHVLGVSATVRPLGALSVDLGFTARLDRRQECRYIGADIWLNDQDYYEGGASQDCSYKLGDLTNLWGGASWRFTPAFTVFGRVDNILNKRSRLIFGIPSQGLTGLVGITYKF